ncbi:xylan 1,4-beta-xylosidase [Streptomyces sp. A244]|uniref:GH39 family glycosyl hydrolase n=1 Tax=Streptomyces TaxID=1883 RepID=UPI000D1A5052|nr:xylan 1,4-beta-xylosidase [Streptomyces sp. A244]PTH90166.1 xylan 1,4-beta-xylosidase [Streptomyces sp. A244]
MAKTIVRAGARRWRAVTLITTIAVALVLVLSHCAAPAGNGERVSQNRSSLGWGLTHTQYSADDGDPAAVATVREALSDPPLPQLQHVMGWGADSPEPSPGRYDFAALDDRMDFIRRTGGTPVITLCCAPDWMKGGEPGRTDWSRRSLETAPSPDHYDDFAALAATIAERYPDVRHFIVWNEFKGFFDETRKRWNYEGYTQLYNRVFRALKKVNDENQVGGPYLNMDSFGPGRTTYASGLKGPWGSVDQRVLDAFAYWNTHKAGADFIVIDGSSYTHDDEALPDPFQAVDKFTTVGRWVRARTSQPLWWAEYYVEPGAENGRDRWSEPLRSAVQAAGMIAMVRGGATTGFYWNPQNRSGACPGCLWRSTEITDGTGGEPQPMLDLVRRFDKEFPPGTVYRAVDVAPSDRSDVRVLGDDETTLVVSTRERPQRVRVDDRILELDAHQVVWLTRS